MLGYQSFRTLQRKSFRGCWDCIKRSLSTEVKHVPVMLEEVIQYLKQKPGEVYIDMTFGAGGHTRQILESVPNAKVFALDRDPVAHNLAVDMASSCNGQLIPLLGRFSDLPHLLSKHGIKRNSIDGIFFDLGCSSMQFDMAERGFSVSKDGPLDMRMDGSRIPGQITAADVLNHAEETTLAKILKVYGEEKQCKKIARAVIEARYLFRHLNTTQELKDLIASACSGDIRMDKLQRPSHVATKSFQALRIFVNNELNELNYGMFLAHYYLRIGGRLVTLSFHSLEDRILKRHFLGIDLDEPITKTVSSKLRSSGSWHSKDTVDKLLERRWEVLTKHVLVPSDSEVDNNPRSRSAKLRAAIKIEPCCR